MSTLRRVLLVVACLLLAIPLAPPASAAPVLVWSDEFDGPSGARPNSAKWAYDIGNGSGGWGNNELEAYTDKTSNVSLNGTGQLVITARRENSGMPCWNGGNCQYTSGKLTTYNRIGWTYGRIEARMKLPYGQGIWPAFWMLGANIGQVGWPNCGEIDIMENIGREPTTVHGTIHGPGYSGAGGIGAARQSPNGQAWSAAYHTYSINWTANRIQWFVDGVLYQTRTPADLGGRNWVFNNKFYLIMNLAVGGQWPGNPDSSTQFPQYLGIDYVRVYQG